MDYFPKTSRVEAWQWLPGSGAARPAWVIAAFAKWPELGGFEADGLVLNVATLDGVMPVRPHQYIVKGSDRRFEAYDLDQFLRLYEHAVPPAQEGIVSRGNSLGGERTWLIQVRACECVVPDCGNVAPVHREDRGSLCFDCDERWAWCSKPGCGNKARGPSGLCAPHSLLARAGEKATLMFARWSDAADNRQDLADLLQTLLMEDGP